ncbi:MAG: HNH endonuclease, partial [candidate division WOR-3 bacterium]
RSMMDVHSKRGRIPVPPNGNKMELPEYRLTARLLGKIGLEALTFRTQSITGWEEEIIDKSELDPVRDFTRFDRGPDWPFVYRPIYLAESVFNDGEEYYQVLHEYDLLYTKGNELYIVVALFGVELALNLGGPEINGYNHWLASHNYASPLYVGKNVKQEN